MKKSKYIKSLKYIKKGVKGGIGINEI